MLCYYYDGVIKGLSSLLDCDYKPWNDKNHENLVLCSILSNQKGGQNL